MGRRRLRSPPVRRRPAGPGRAGAGRRAPGRPSRGGFAYGRPLRFQHGGPLPEARTQSTGSVVYPGQWWLERRFREGTGCITSPEVVVRTGLQREVGGYDPALPHAGDIEMWMRLAAHADVGYIRGADQAFYRVHGKNMSTVDFGGQLDDLRQRLVAFDSVLAKCGDRLPHADRLADQVHTRLARYALRRPTGPTTGAAPKSYPSTRAWRSPRSACPDTRRCPSTARCGCADASGRRPCRICSPWCGRPWPSADGSGCGGSRGSAAVSDA
ncbi:hypothetical protein O1M54_05945 [Streptomyces diastatochromogenes]|nr:hypothetical protein [Streptomyces diastatochromogenes]